MQGLFKDFPGPDFEISRTFLYTNLPTAKQNVCVESYVLGINLYCFHWLLFNLKLISIIFRSCSLKKSSTFKDQKPISSTFKALKLDPRNSRVFKGFQDPYEPRD